MLFSLVVAACGGDSATDDTDDFTEAACRDFRAAAQDQTEGVLTPDELRAELQEVNERAQFSEDAGISAGGVALIAAATAAGDNVSNDQALADAVTAFGTACTDAGY